MKNLWFVIVLAFLASCNLVEVRETGTEDVDPLGTIPSFPTTEANFTQLFHSTSGQAWDADGFTLAGNTSFLSCRLDDQMMLMANETNPLIGTYEYNGGDDLCGAEDDQVSKFGTYQINFTNKTVVFDAGTNNESVASVVGLDENEIVLEGSYLGLKIRGKYKLK